MFKNLTKLENSMCSVMKKINTTSDLCSLINSFNTNELNALHQCFKNGYVENIQEDCNSNGIFIFNSLGNTHINQKGLQFIRNCSFLYRIKNAIFDILKGVSGFIIGVVTSLTVQFVVQCLKNPQAMIEFLLDILRLQ